MRLTRPRTQKSSPTLCKLILFSALVPAVGIPDAVGGGVSLKGTALKTSLILIRSLYHIRFGVTAVITVLALWFIYNRMMASRKRVLLEMRKDLQAKDVAVTMPAGYDETADGETQTQTHQGRDFRHPFRGPNAIHGR